MNKKQVGEFYKKKFCPKCEDKDLTVVSDGTYICNKCGYPNRIKVLTKDKE